MKSLTQEEFYTAKRLLAMTTSKQVSALSGLGLSTIGRIKKSDTLKDYKALSKKQHPKKSARTWKIWTWKKNTR